MPSMHSSLAEGMAQFQKESKAKEEKDLTSNLHLGRPDFAWHDQQALTDHGYEDAVMDGDAHSNPPRFSSTRIRSITG